MRFAFAILLLCTSARSAEFRLSPDTPPLAREAIGRAVAEYQAYGAVLPRICFKWATRGQCPYGAYAMSTMHRNGKRVIWTIFINATDLTWPRWEVALDDIVLHEIGHAEGWDHQPADSVMENPIRSHLRASDIARIGGSQ